MKTFMQRASALITSVLLLGAASAGCWLPADPGAERLDVAELGAREQDEAGEAECPEGIETTIIELGTNEYFIGYRATLDSPVGEVWSKVQNIKSLIDIAFAGQTSDFQWLNGGSPGHVPALYQFNFGPQTIVEEVTYRNSADTVLRYRVAVVPVIGIEAYTAEVKLTPCGMDTLLEFTREVTFSEGVSIDAFSGLFEQEVANIQAHFAGAGGS